METKQKAAFTPTPVMLTNRISKEFRDLMRRTGERAGIPDRYRELLRYLAHTDGRTQHELATLVGLTPPTVSVTLRAMEQEGYVTRSTHQSDQRITLVYLTEKGRETNKKMRSFADHYDAQIMEGISEEERRTVTEVLSRMRENLKLLRKGEGGK